ncbi:hypothetical protein NM688_g1116 [Phlebia brevispora]|uniref:Uncharacterized protein n=1 Tax=Phlebia brevispora TaxID=194682 RepID=A0ACC1TCJ8_9APHY|nr:hypothetical protein NM688_g1116 [Phlebia brevispora]
MSKIKLSDRAWNDPGPRPGHDENAENMKRHDLRAIVLDLSTVSHVDTTAVQALIDTRTEIERWTNHPVEFHFATVLSPWIRRALVAGGFGTGARLNGPTEIAQVVSFGDVRSSPPTEKNLDIEDRRDAGAAIGLI